MKYLFLFILFASFNVSFAQKDEPKELISGDFKIVDSELIWSHVFEVPDKSKEAIKQDLLQFYKMSNLFEKIDTVSFGISLQSKLHKCNYKKYGGTLMNTANVLANDEIQYNAFIYIKDGKYLCEVKNMSAMNTRGNYINDNIKKINFEEFVYNKKAHKWKGFHDYVFKPMNNEFLDYFELKVVKEKDF